MQIAAWKPTYHFPLALSGKEGDSVGVKRRVKPMEHMEVHRLTKNYVLYFCQTHKFMLSLLSTPSRETYDNVVDAW
jgi:hypothetical protein